MKGTNSKPTSTANLNLTARSVTRLRNHSNRRRAVQNYRLVWLDTNVSMSEEESQHILESLRSEVNEVNMFTELEECVTFLQGIQLEKVFLIASGYLGQTLVPQVHSMTQIDTIFILCGDKSRHEEWAKKWPKVKGAFTQIKPISEALERTVKQCDQDCVAVSFASTNVDDVSKINLNQLEPSFIYTQLFKNILLDMEHDRKQAVPDLMEYCRHAFHENPAQLVLVNEFGRDYRSEQAIWWYTREGFTYQMLNRALRLLEADIIVNMGFFIHDLHQQIQQLHQEQVGNYGGRPFLVYRGQGLSITDFEKLQETKGGLMSFNCFLSTSTKSDIPMMLAESSAMGRDKAGILFMMTIDPNIAPIPFADVQKESFFETEAEVLFSMHTVFRIGTIKRKDCERPYFEVTLSLSTDVDTQLTTLMDQLDGENQASDKWEHMAQLLIQVRQPDKAEELYHTLLEHPSSAIEESRYYHQLGFVKDDQGDYKEALSCHEQALAIRQKSLPGNHPDWATSYNNIGEVFRNMGEYPKALSFYERALEILQKNLSANHPVLASSYNNIGTVYYNMGEYSKALSYHERALELRQESLPANHPDLAISYNNIGLLHNDMGEYSKALSFHERSLEIIQKSLSPNHPEWATSYNNIALVYDNVGEYSKALSFYERALAIRQKSLAANHPVLASSYNNIGEVFGNMGDYSKALSYHERALEINGKSLSVNHPSLATSYNNVGMVYKNMGEYSKALSFYERALEIRQKSLPANHPDWATSYNNIGEVFRNMGEYSKALSYHERALTIRQKSLPVNHPVLVSSYNNIGTVYYSMGEYSKALIYHERALEIHEKSLPVNHPAFATSYNNK